MTALAFVVAVLATYRVSYLIAQEEGPFGIMAWLRGKIDPNQATWLGRGVRCVACVSVWIALIAALLIGATWGEWLAIAGGVLVIHKAVNDR
jgi:hypothetical protein